jgi:hypothetical protein
MNYNYKVRLLSDEDIYDVYGCQALMAKEIDTFHLVKVKTRVREIQELYVNSAKARIRSEARFLGVDAGDECSLAYILEQVRKLVEVDVRTQMMTGGPVNLMGSFLKAHKMAGSDLSGINLAKYGVDPKPIEKPKPPSIDPNWFKKGAKNADGSQARMFDDPKWNEIAKQFLKIEQATDPKDICVQIDILNALQHNSFHVLIDLQTGRMLEGRSEGQKLNDQTAARTALQEILDIAKGKASVEDYADKMSAEIRELIKKYWHLADTHPGRISLDQLTPPKTKKKN